MKLPASTLLLASAMAFSQTSCVTRSTVHSRIAAYPAYFEKLSDKQKDLVTQNRITEGMGKEAVYLAWGSADEVKRSSRNNRTTETWIYLQYEPVYSRSFNVGYGYGGPRYYRRRNCGYGGWGDYYSDFGYGTDVTYQPYVGAKVEFEKDRVVFWETVR
jgi:hypothetical protein